MADNFEEIDYWKAIILYGLNQATYKIALGKTILELAVQGKETVDWGYYLKRILTIISSVLIIIHYLSKVIHQEGL